MYMIPIRTCGPAWVSHPSVYRSISSCLHGFVRALDMMKFPSDDQTLRQVKAGFYGIAGFPCVVGAIDGTLIPITRPTDDEEVFACRKGFHALTIQAICDSTLRSTNIVCKWPGNTHYSFILCNSRIGKILDRRAGVDGWLLGDSGSWLLTPYINPAKGGEETYNRAYARTRNTVEQAFGLLKSSCLLTTDCLPIQPTKAHRVVYAACQLHNFSINIREPSPPPPP